jgi:hypothetical protein
MLRLAPVEQIPDKEIKMSTAATPRPRADRQGLL